MGRSKKRKSEKRTSIEMKEQKVDKEETKPAKESEKKARKSSSGIWTVTKACETNTAEKPQEDVQEKEEIQSEVDPIAERSDKQNDSVNEPSEEEHNSSPKKADRGEARKRSHTESISEEDAADDLKKRRIFDQISSEDGNRQSPGSNRVGSLQETSDVRNTPNTNFRDVCDKPKSSEKNRRSGDKTPGKRRSRSTKISVFELTERKEVIILIKNQSDLVFWGKAEMQVVWGSVSMMGYTMNHTSLERWPVYSPGCNSYIKLHAMLPEGPNSTDLCKNAVEQYIGSSMDEEKLTNLLSEVAKKTVVISVKQLDEQHLQFIQTFSPFQDLFPPCSDDPLGSIGVSVVESNVGVFNVTPEMKDIQCELMSSLQAGKCPVVAVCGGGNVGKSTLCRFLVNTVLNCRKEVAYLECDVGQTEFTVPACLALNVVRQPLLGPPFTHQRTPDRMCYFGAVSPGNDPGQYLRTLRQVYEAYQALPEKPVLIVNTMGWIQDLGLTLLAETLRMVSPTIVVQINKLNMGRIYCKFDSLFVRNLPRWGQHKDSDSSAPNNEYRHKLIEITSPVSFPLYTKKLRPKDHRNLALLSCLGRMGVQPHALHTVRPHKVHWKTLALHVCHTAVPNSQVLKVLNGSLVAMCHVPEGDIVETFSEDQPKFLGKMPISICFGFGVVRSIDPKEKCLYIQTPMCQTDLGRVNCLIKGCLDLPADIALTQPQDENGEVPYVGEPLDLVGATEVPKSSHLVRIRPAATD